ncbi:MAG: segregation/condensation protein A [Clostridiales bacterium]|jgi:segregation and condensation protein A|nr:segregation/condensation protein A [Clostridiales bacterium]
MTVLNYKLEKFEGPLDLCLSLIQKNKMKIEDIQISVLCDQYMEYINAAQEMDIELSSDFLLTASELMLIKSKMLLPRNEEEEEDPRMALAAAMMEYQRAKEAAGILREMYAEYGMRMGKDTDEISVDKTYVAEHDAALLSKALLRIMSEVRVTDEEAKEKFKPLINKKTVSVAAIVENLAGRLQGGRKVRLHGFFQSAQSRAEIVTMFLALLELLKSGMLLLLDESPEETRSGVIDTAGEVYVKLEPDADISQLTQIIQDE